jgi:hypothetical protein
MQPKIRSVGLDETTKSRIKDEQAAPGQLQTQWPQLTSKDETDISGIPPSYVELLTCLQDQQIAKKMNS